MAVEAKLNYLRITPRKVRLVADLIRGKKVSEALAELDFARKSAAQPLKKLLNSAIANAEHNFGLSSSNLYISKIFVDEGPKLKRWRARAQGRFFPIEKKTSHIILVLDEIKEKPKAREKAKAPAPKAKEKKKIKKVEKPRWERKLKERRPHIPDRFKRVFRRKAF